MKNIITTIILLATTFLSAQTEKFTGKWECNYSDLPMGINYNAKKDWLEVTTFTPEGKIDLVEIYVLNNKDAKRAERYANRKKLYNKTLVYKRSN